MSTLSGIISLISDAGKTTHYSMMPTWLLFLFHCRAVEIHSEYETQLCGPFSLRPSSDSSNKHKPVKVSLENKGPLVPFGPLHFILPSKPNSNTINILNHPLKIAPEP